MSTAGMLGGLVAAVDSFQPSLVARSTGHQALLAGANAGVGYWIGRGTARALDVLPLRIAPSPWARAALLGTAATAAVPLVRRRAAAQRQAHADWGAPPMRPGAAAIQGAALATALVGGTRAVNAVATRVAHSASERFGGRPEAYFAASAIAAGVVLGLSSRQGKRRLLDRLTEAGNAPDPAFLLPPANPMVSGGPGSLVAFSSHAREGARFVHLPISVQTIHQLSGQQVKVPIRVFVGVAAAATAAERVDLAVAELERLGAFDRQYLLAVSPAGSGYANPVAVEALELLSGGDCATVVVAYGVLPSMLSGPAMPSAALTYRLLIDAVANRGPRLLVYGESLGAQAAQAALSADPSRRRRDGSITGVDSALFVGTPPGGGWREASRAKPAVVLADRWQDLIGQSLTGVSVFLLDHDADPVTRLQASLLWARPDWLSREPRGRGIPSQMAWRPLLTYLQVLFDVARATQPQLGQFHSHGHDYRADLARMVQTAFVPQATEASLAAVDEQLLRNERRRADLLAQRDPTSADHPANDKPSVAEHLGSNAAPGVASLEECADRPGRAGRHVPSR